MVKNVAGYDMMKVLIGSQGTLGIITSASFKLFPAPRQTRTFVSEFASAEEAFAFRNRVLHSPLDPICLLLVSPEAGALVKSAGSWSILLRAAGSDAVLARYRAEMGTAVSREIEGQRENDLWRAVSDFPCLVQERHARSLLISMTLPLADVDRALEGLALVAHSNDLTLAAVGRVGVGHLLIAMWPAPDAEVTMVNFVDAASGLRNRLPQLPLRHGGSPLPAEARHHVTAWKPMPTDLESMRKVKMTLDPRDVLNRGRFLF